MDRALAVQVDALGDLLEGWFDDEIEPYPAGALDWVGRVLDHLVGGFKVPIPYLYPTPQGRVRAGWVNSRWDVIADIDLTTHAVDLLAWKVATHEIHERQLQLEAHGAEAKLGRFVADHTG
jgi:hypothetical protein